MSAWGSSPLTRGKLPGRRGHETAHRLIPAHAGKTEKMVLMPSHTPAHPRSRGENVAVSVPTGGREGSSPLTRGKLQARHRSAPRPGLIPAHAGKTEAGEPWHTTPGAHPRSRVENRLSVSTMTSGGGSSPLTRGKLGLKPAWEPIFGLIPAHAGKTESRSSCSVSQQAHPRSRGENGLPGFVDAYDGGSSPLTRGKRQGTRIPHDVHGLIPAHAGKTAPFPPTVWNWTAHPRSRGENGTTFAVNCAAKGSSPLTRGKRVLLALQSLPDGLIPAHAGKTSA